MRKILVVVGSEHDLPQCQKGLRFLKENSSVITVRSVFVASQHRHTKKVEEILMNAVLAGDIDAIIAAAGASAHLPGCMDALLRYTLKNDKITVLGVAMDNPANREHTEAAFYSIAYVPKTQMIFKDTEAGFFVGEGGFLRACDFAAYGILPKIVLHKAPETLTLTLDQAIDFNPKPKP